MVSLQVTNMQLTSSQRLPLLGAASRWNRTSGSHQLCDSCNGRVVIDQSDLKKPKENVYVGKSWNDSRDFCLGYAGIVWCFMIWGPGLREAKCQWVYGLEDCRMILPPKVGDCHADFASGIEMMFTTGMRILFSWIRRQKQIEYVYQMDALGNIMFCMILHIRFSHTIHLTNGCQLITSNIINNESMLILPNTLIYFAQS